jgi:hypothetical protein
MTKLEGGCLCGKVRYVVSAEPIFSGACHCRNCQKETGSAFNQVLGVPSDALAVTGAVQVYDGRGDSGQPTHRSFCPTCGSPIASNVDVMPGISMISIGTLDDPSVAVPQMHIYCRSKLDWITLPEGVGVFPAMPPPPG